MPYCMPNEAVNGLLGVIERARKPVQNRISNRGLRVAQDLGFVGIEDEA